MISFLPALDSPKTGIPKSEPIRRTTIRLRFSHCCVLREHSLLSFPSLLKEQGLSSPVTMTKPITAFAVALLWIRIAEIEGYLRERRRGFGHQENLGSGLFSTVGHQRPDIVAHANTLVAMGRCLARKFAFRCRSGRRVRL